VKIELNHTIVPAHDKEQSARFYEKIFGFKYKGRCPPTGLVAARSGLQAVLWKRGLEDSYARSLGVGS
jgi:hypothetical protein